MAGIIVANSRPEAAKKIAYVLRSAGLPVAGLCGAGAKVIEYSRRQHAVVVCGGHLTDLPALRLPDMCGRGMDFLFLLRAEELQAFGDSAFLRLRMPLVKAELVASAELLLLFQEKKHVQTGKAPGDAADERAVVERAKGLLMERNWMTEEKAHRFLQKKSMECGCRMAESARLVLSVRQP